MRTNNISLQEARNLAINSQLLDNRFSKNEGKNTVAAIIDSLGYVQIDTISVIERAHHHTLWTRYPGYQHSMLHDLQANDRRIFEYWGHAASYLPMSDYRYYIRRMNDFRFEQDTKENKHYKICKPLRDPVLKRIRDEGPLTSRDFKESENNKNGTWWNWKPTKFALEMLLWRGELMISERKGFQRLYDLTERVLPKHIDTALPSERAQGLFLIHRALNAYGVVRFKEIIDHIRGTKKTIIQTVLMDLVDQGKVIPIEIESCEEQYYCLKAALNSPNFSDSINQNITILSPFDNLVIQRDRIKILFHFDYTIECYVPKALRKYGYFSLPILFGNNFIARMDAKADRKSKSFIIRNIVFEQHVNQVDEFWDPLKVKLQEFAKFNGCQKIILEKASPGKYKQILSGILKN